MIRVDLEKRIESAMDMYCSKIDSMHVPPKDTDIDVVLSDALAEIGKQKQQIKQFEDFKKNQIEDFNNQVKSLHASRESLLEYKNKIESGEFVFVPREPTQAMMINALAVIATGIGKKHIDVEIIKCWEKMIEAVEKDHE